MLKIISSKNESSIYDLARKEKETAKVVGSFSDCEIDEAVTNAENISIFGDTNAFLINVNGTRGVSEENLNFLTKELFASLENSPHFFVIVGSGSEFEKIMTPPNLPLVRGGTGQKVQLQKIIEKVTFDFPADLVTALQKHDKKNSWDLMLKELEKKDAEPIHGSCIFAYKSLLVYMNDPEKNNPNSGVKDFSWNSAKRNAIAGKRERQEVSEKYFNLVLNYHKARNGELDLKTQLEKWVLEN